MKPRTSSSGTASEALRRVWVPCAVHAGAILVGIVLATPVAAQQAETVPLDPAPVPVVPSPLYSFGLGYAPNGAIVTSQDSVNGSWSYSYDPLNRLAAAAGVGRSLTYDYDRNGNRWRQNSLDGLSPSRAFTFDTSSNRIVGMTYDKLGNLIDDGVHTYTYDAENRLIKVDGGAVAEYSYDAFGRRVRKAAASTVTEYLYDAAGRVAAERDASTGKWNRREVYAAGRHVATYAGDTTYFHHQDWLGSNRVTTLPDGTLAEQCASLPFGDGLACAAAGGRSSTPTPFADYERDRETELDHAWFRQYASTQGRWTTLDPHLGSMDPSNPQSFNRYSFVLNRPLDLADPRGLDQSFVFWEGSCLYSYNRRGNTVEIIDGTVIVRTYDPEISVVFCDWPGADGGREAGTPPGPTVPPGTVTVPLGSVRSCMERARSQVPTRPAHRLTRVPNAEDPPQITGSNLPFHLSPHPFDRFLCALRNDPFFGGLLGLDWANCIREERGEELEEEQPLYHGYEREVNQMEHPPGECKWPPVPPRGR